MIGWSFLCFCPCHLFELLVVVCLIGAEGLVVHYPFDTRLLNGHKTDDDRTILVLVVLPIYLGCRSTSQWNGRRPDGYRTIILFEMAIYPCLLVVLAIASWTGLEIRPMLAVETGPSRMVVAN